MSEPMSDTDLTSEDLRDSIEGGVSPSLLAQTAPTLALAIEAYTYEYGRMAEVAQDAMNDSDDSGDYWRGRLDAYASVRSELMSTLQRHDEIDRMPLRSDEVEQLASDQRGTNE